MMSAEPMAAGCSTRVLASATVSAPRTTPMEYTIRRERAYSSSCGASTPGTIDHSPIDAAAAAAYRRLR